MTANNTQDWQGVPVNMDFRFGTLAELLGRIAGRSPARDGFDLTRHALSLMSNGDLGWIQITNFLLTGLLVIACAIGMRRVLPPGRASTWGPRLLGVSTASGCSPPGPSSPTPTTASRLEPHPVYPPR